MPNDFDQIAIVVDWLDACRTRDLDALLDLYAQDASLECECEGGFLHAGRTGLEAHWRPRLAAVSSTAFGMDEIIPTKDGVVLDYMNVENQLVRIFFTFNDEGKILLSRCAPSPR